MNDTLTALKSNKPGTVLPAIKEILSSPQSFDVNQVVSSLIHHLSSEHREIKLASIQALGQLKVASAVDPLSMLLLNPPTKKSPLTGEPVSEKNDIELTAALVTALQKIDNLTSQTTISLWQRVTPPGIVEAVRKQVAAVEVEFTDDDDQYDTDFYRSATATREIAIPIMPPAPKPESITPPAQRKREAERAEEEINFEDSTRPSGVDIPLPSQAPEDGETVKPVQFSVYYPREVLPKHWYPLTTYIHLPSAQTDVSRDVVAQYGVDLSTVRRIVGTSQHNIPEGTLITATPHLTGFQFNPPQIQIGFYEEWHRLDFKMRSQSATLNLAQNGRLTFTIEDIIIADVPLSVFVLASSTEDYQPRLNTLTQNVYQAIFCSYSRDDRNVVEKVERLYTALGFDFLRDMQTIKSGQDWDDQLYAMIERADIFQLFWSRSAALSEWVGKEWRYALSLEREAQNFIRPVYWQEPIPVVPPELSHIHFSYEPTLDD